MSAPGGLAMSIQETAPAAGASLRRLLAEALAMPDAAAIAAPFLTDLTARERGVRAVLLYGSALWRSVRGDNSQPDFIVVTDRVSGWRGRRADRLFEGVLPPTVYRLSADREVAKICVVTATQLRAQTSAEASDLHLAGRLCKRVALVWCRDGEAQAGIVDAQQSALQTVGRLALSRFRQDVGLDDFVKVLLGLSYESEIRIVEPHKITALFEAERDHYRAVGRALLETLGARPLDGAAERFQLPPDADLQAWRSTAERLLRRSRRRALLRWPKYLATYDGWLDYLLLKLERSGSPVVLTANQRRHPFLLAAPVLYRLIRAKRVH